MAIRNILRLPAVERASGLKKTQIYHKIAEGDFPRPVKLSAQAVGWFEDEIVAWQEARKRAEGGWRPGDRRKRHEAA